MHVKLENEAKPTVSEEFCQTFTAEILNTIFT